MVWGLSILVANPRTCRRRLRALAHQMPIERSHGLQSRHRHVARRLPVCDDRSRLEQNSTKESGSNELMTLASRRRVLRMALKKWQLGLTLAVGSLFGFLAANSHWERPANAAIEKRTERSLVARTDPFDTKSPRHDSTATCCCSKGTSRGEMVALAAHNQLVATTLAQTDKKPNICIIWGDDIGQIEHQRLHDGPDGLPHAQHRPRRQGRHDLHRLLRRAKLHGRPGLVHHRPARSAHRPDQGRPARRDSSDCGRKTRPSPSCSSRSDMPPASSARTTSATATSSCRRFTASTSSTATCTT